MHDTTKNAKVNDHFINDLKVCGMCILICTILGYTLCMGNKLHVFCIKKVIHRKQIIYYGLHLIFD